MAMSDTTRPDGDHEQDDPFGEDPPYAEDDAREYADGFSETGELELGDDDARLPWLEGDDDEEDYEGYGAGQLGLFVLIGLLLLGLIVGGIWWFTRGNADPELVADGSVIEAPAEPYKEKPEDPGGMVAEGTGDSSFAVSEGQSRPAQLGETAETPKPGFETVGAPSAAPATAAKPASGTAGQAVSEAADVSGAGVQVGAYSSRSSAETGWSRLSQQYAALSGMRYRIVEGQADIGTVYRLQALPGDLSAANALCSKLKASGLNCHVKK